MLKNPLKTQEKTEKLSKENNSISSNLYIIVAEMKFSSIHFFSQLETF